MNYSEPESSEPDSPPRELSSPLGSIDCPEEPQPFLPTIRPTDSDNSSTASSGDSSSGSEEWDESDADEHFESSTYMQAQVPERESAFVRWMTILILAFQAAYFLPNPATEWVLVFFSGSNLFVVDYLSPSIPCGSDGNVSCLHLPCTEVGYI